MITTINGTTYEISRRPSIYTNRKGKDDCRIFICQPPHETHKGGRRNGNMICRTIRVIACESGEIIREFDCVPKELNNELLKQNAFIDIGENMDENVKAERIELSMSIIWAANNSELFKKTCEKFFDDHLNDYKITSTVSKGEIMLIATLKD